MEEPGNAGGYDDSASRGGGRLADGATPSFRMWREHDHAVPVLISVPHAGRIYSAELVERMREPDSTMLRLEDRHADTLAREVAQNSGVALLIADAPRALIDLNRAPDDVDWSMVAGKPPSSTRHSLANRRARSGLGLIPRRISGVGELWRAPLERTDLERRIEDVHRPYHRALGDMLERMRDQWGAALLLDLHSMPPLQRRIPDEVPAEFVVGDRFGASCSSQLSAVSLRYFAAHGRPAAHNRPYSGGYVLDRHGAPLRGVHAMQIEVSRNLYLDARLDGPTARLASVARLLAGLVMELADQVSALGRDRGQALAAE